MKLKFIPIAFIGAALVACGGGGGGGGSSNGTAAQLQVTAKVNGAIVTGYPATAASAPAITLSSGQELEITSSIPSGVVLTKNGVVEALRANTSTTYRAVLAASIDTSASLLVTTASLPLQQTNIPITVKAAQFHAVVPNVGDSFVYAENDILVNKSAFKFDNRTQRVDAVNPDGTWRETYLTPTNAAIGVGTYTREGNLTSFRTDAASTQNCDDGGNKLRKFAPEEKLLAFPLTVGTSFTGVWKTTCGTDTTVTASQDESISAKVVGYESVTTAAGVFNALRIDEVTTVTNSTNAAFPGGGYRQTVSVWFDPVLGRNIKFSGQRTYAGAPTTAQAAALVETTNIELVSFIKN